VAETNGGRIEFTEAAGNIRTRSGGGGVRIARVAGPTVLDSGDGGVFLADVTAPMHASTSNGTITAWLSPRFGGAPSTNATVSELTSSQGDIVVYLPREIAVTIDAQIERNSDRSTNQNQNRRIVADPSLPLKVAYQPSGADHTLHAQAALNGGGPVLHLKAGSGNIQLRNLDADIERQLAAQQMAMAAQGLALQRAMMLEMQRQAAAAFGNDSPAPQPEDAETASLTPTPIEDGGISGIVRLFEGFWWGGVRVDPEEQQSRLQHAVRPTYPEAARQAGLQGDVTLRIVIGADGTVKDVRAVAGDPELVRAAASAVSQWQYAPALLDGRPVGVVTTVTLAFRLQ
jgi:protein TonB